ncbi:hypothetical protein PsorP6_012057 [Peronosclerospora sorghi]|uniref:Uncharacterized protein n=1 Tax=Peronosclerospora sorghi TaxID=230839 RepID=A0ACC0WKX7_9STRA|nr:hypothetical protein PsorP6_012057 [Peronosclerospora sorghi]
MEKLLVYTIHHTAQRTVEKRGIVLQLFDGIATIGVSLILELRSMNVDLPIEVPHCGDLKQSIQNKVLEKKTDVGAVHFYDVYQLSSQTTSLLDSSRKVFCQYLSVSMLNRYISQFDVSHFALLDSIEQPKDTSENKIQVELKNYSPSEHLLISHSWNQCAGHEMDSSLVLWNKKRQPRATAILGSLLRSMALADPRLTVTKSFTSWTPSLQKHSTPSLTSEWVAWARTSKITARASQLSAVMPHTTTRKKPVYYSQARLYEVYAGYFEERGLEHECPFDVTAVRFLVAHENRDLRQRFHEIVTGWVK